MGNLSDPQLNCFDLIDYLGSLGSVFNFAQFRTQKAKVEIDQIGDEYHILADYTSLAADT